MLRYELIEAYDGVILLLYNVIHSIDIDINVSSI